MHSMARFAMVAGLALSTACTMGDDSDLNVSGGEPVQLGEGDIRITSRGGEIDLMLVGDRIVAGLSDSVLAKVRSETDTSDLDADGGLGASIEKYVKGTVQKALSKRVDYPLSDIEDARYEDGRIVFDYVDGANFTMLESTKNDDIPLLASFSEEDSKRFVAAVKARKDQST
jgi:hypothetical protein